MLCLVAQSCLTLCNPHGLLPPRLLHPWGFSRQEYWSGLPFPSPGDLSNPWIEHCRSPTLQVVLYCLSHQSKGIDTRMCVTESLLSVCVSGAKSCLTLCNPTDYSLLGSSVHGIFFFFFQARMLESVATVLLQGIFLTQGSKLSPLCLLHCRRILYLLNRQGSPHFSINLKLIQHFKSTVLLFKKLPTCFKRIFNDASLLPEHIFIGKVVLVQLLSHV